MTDIRPPQPRPVPPDLPPPTITPTTTLLPPQSGGFKAWLSSHRNLLIAGLVVLLLGGSAAAVWYWKLRPRPAVNRQEETPVTKEPEPPPAAAVPITSPLTGVAVTDEQAKRQVTAIVIENHPDARPQSGLSEAGVVYEALAEGGITRFLALYQETQPGALGPVRSLRPYFIDWALEFGAPIAHAGGSADAIALVAPTGAKSMNLLIHGTSAYRTRDRYAPHNLYTRTDLLDQLKARLGYVAPASFAPTPRKPDTPLAASATKPTIKLSYSYAGYQVEYRYDAASNSYTRFLAGKPHIDRNNNQPIMVKNVVVEMMPVSYARTGHAIMPTVGRGQAFVYRDGGVVEGSWVKASRNERTKLVDAAGNDITLNVGNTWYSIVPVGRPPQ